MDLLTVVHGRTSLSFINLYLCNLIHVTLFLIYQSIHLFPYFIFASYSTIYHIVYELWAYNSFDDRESIMNEALHDEEWRDTGE